jgi:hypothetical protein
MNSGFSLVNPTSILFLLFVFFLLRLLFCMQMLSYHFHKLGRHLTNRRGWSDDRSRIRCDTFCVLQSLSEQFGGCVGRISGACVSYNVRFARCVADEPNAVFCLWSWYDSLLPQMRRNICHFYGRILFCIVRGSKGGVSPLKYTTGRL